MDELREEGVTTVWYDQKRLESLSDTTPLPDDRRNGIDASEVRKLIYTSGMIVAVLNPIQSLN